MTSKVLVLFLAASLLVLGVATAARTRPVAAMSATAPGKCGVSTVSLGACASALRPALRAKVATSPVQPCCSVVKGLVDAEAAACLCTAVKVAVGVPRPAPSGSVPIGFGFVLNNCGRKAPADFTCE